MLTRDLPLHLLALLVYPGLALLLAIGAAAEAGAALALGGAGARVALLVPAARLRDVVRRPGGLSVLLLAMLAATQLAVPFNPVLPVERNLLVAAVAATAATWLAAGRAWATGEARRALLVQVCWLLALLAPALVSQSLRPQALGAVVVPAAMPLKVAAALLALLCLPGLLRLPPGQPDDVTRVPLWLPLCGLLVSLYLPPGADDLQGLVRFLAATLLTAAAAIGLAAVVDRSRLAGRLYPRLLAPLALAVLVVAAVTSSLT